MGVHNAPYDIIYENVFKEHNMGRPKGSKNKVHRTLKERFWEKVDKRGIDECWEWQAFIHPSGYGMIAQGNNARKMLLAHRVSWELEYGEIPFNVLVCHDCDNRKCVNYNHLFLGNYKDNSQDMITKGRGKLPDNRGEKHGLSKLCDDDVRFIRANPTISRNELAKMFKVSNRTISKVRLYRSWKHLENGVHQTGGRTWE